VTAPLVMRDVHVRIGNTAILNGISLSVNDGEAVGLVGESGSGKTMTARTATGLLRSVRGRIASGSVRVAGREMATASDRDWNAVRGKTIALVPQNSLSSLDPIMTVGRQLRETIVCASRPGNWRAEAGRLLQLVHLDPDGHLLARYPHELSGGMRQRVMIALALAVRPKILVADEPTTALDVSLRSGILALLKELRDATGLALVLVSHDLAAIRSATDNVLVMHHGQVVETGPTSQVIEHPRHRYTRSLIMARPELSEPGQPLPVERFDA
jgi:ABC-type dipeptide/oligopeptide/nickel transport system ATPase component